MAVLNARNGCREEALVAKLEAERAREMALTAARDALREREEAVQAKERAIIEQDEGEFGLQCMHVHTCKPVNLT